MPAEVDPLAMEQGEQIGRGSSGRVLRARDPATGKVRPDIGRCARRGALDGGLARGRGCRR